MNNDDIISRRDLLERVEKERAYLKARGLYGAEEILTKYLRNIVEDVPPTEMESPVIKINIPEGEVQKLLEELQKPHKVLVLPEPEVEFVRPHGEWTDLSVDGRHTGWIACSVCGQEPPNESNLRTDFCPNCGADLRGRKNG